jgi:hypothetical protein
MKAKMERTLTPDELDEITDQEARSVAYSCLFWAAIIAIIFITGSLLWLRSIFN